MFIRRAKIRTTESGDVYYSYRLVRNERSGDRVRQHTLLNLGSDFPLERRHWPVLCARIQQLLERQGELVPLSCPQEVERDAQRIAAQLLNRAPPAAVERPDLQTVDVSSLELIRPRSVGVENVGLWAMEQLGLEALLERLGFNGTQRALAMATIIARMAAPGSERASWRWLCERSALGELRGVDFERMSMMRLYRASDALLAQRAAIEAHLFEQVADLFALPQTVTLYDLTNTFFEGEAAAQPKAERGHSKEKRSDCPRLTLGLVLDGAGFVRRSEVFAGAVNEDTTLAPMLDALHAPADALVVMDAGIATEANVVWLRENGYRYLVVSRERARRFDPDLAIALETRSRQTVHVHKVVEADGGEVRLYCYSEARAKTEQGIAARFAARFEGELRKLHDGLKRPRTRKRLDHVWQRIGRIKEKSRGVGAHYVIDVIADDSGKKARAVTWERRPLAGTMITHPGVYWPAHQRRGLGRGDVVAHLYCAHGCGGRVPLAQIRTRPAPHLPPDPEALRRAPVHHRDRLPAGADHPPAPRRAGGARKLGQPATHPRRPAAHHGNLPAQGRPHPSCAQTDARGAPTTGHLSGARRRPRSRSHQEDDRLTPNPAQATEM